MIKIESMGKFFDELKRRNVIKAGIAYVVVSWILIQVLSSLLPNFGTPEWVFKTLTLLIFIGFPIWLVFSWVYEVTPEGLKQTKKVSKDSSISAITNKRLNILILVGLVVAVLTTLLLKPQFTDTPQIVSNNTEQDLSIAVLPFDDMSSEGDTQWFCDGITEDILTHLSKVSSIRVISRTSVMQYKNHKKTIPEIARELGVSHILEGSVRKHNNNVLITAQLIEANDKHLWADNFNEKLDNVFKIQNDVSKKIVQQLKIKLTSEEEKSLNKNSTTNAEAYEIFLKGRAAYDETKESFKKSIDLIKQAIALDPKFADAYATIGSYTLYHVESGLMNYDEGLLDAKQYLDKALEIDPQNGIAFNRLVRYYIIIENDEKVLATYKKALELNPNNSALHLSYGIYNFNKTIPDLKMYEKYTTIGQKLDPFSSYANAQKISALLFNKKVVEAKEHYNKMKFTINKSQQEYLEVLLKVHSDKNYSELIEFRKKFLEKNDKNPWAHNAMGKFYLRYTHDYKLYLFHTEKAYELSQPNYGLYKNYFYALLYNKEFKKAKELLNNKEFMAVFTGARNNYIYFDYHYYKGEYQKAITYLEKHKKNSQYNLNKAAVYAHLGDTAKVREVFETKERHYQDKAMVFAIQKSRDSMYYYLEKIAINNAPSINNYPEFDPYRDEPRFIQFLKNNYLFID